jgi:RNA polymerase sigma-70 factor (ECF subfamily)
LDKIIPQPLLETLLEQHWRRLVGVLTSLVGDQAEAEDLALETFWRLYQRPPAGQDSDRLGGWLYRVGTRLGYNALRSRRRRERYEATALQQYLTSDEALDPSGQVEAAEQAWRVRQVLAEMKPRLAQALVLRYSGFAYDEIASALELSPGSVGTILARAERDFLQRFTQKWREE